MSFFRLDKFIFLTASVFSGKSALLILAYFLNEAEYNLFNKAYYTASLLILFGTLGFRYVLARMNISARTMIASVILNIGITFLVIYIISPPFDSTFHSISVICYSIFACIGGIYFFRLLFSGIYTAYSMMQIFYALFHISLIPAVKIFQFDLYTIFPFVTFFWMLAGIKFFNSSEAMPEGTLRDLYKTGISAFIINAAVPAALIVDKYVINHHFPVATANSYTFAWAISAPLFYVGNVIEKMIYSSGNKNSVYTFKKALLALGIILLIYVGILSAVIIFIPSLLPRSVDAELLKPVFFFMVSGYAAYVLFHFPVNGYLFRYSEIQKQSITAAAFAVFILIFTAAAFYIFYQNPIQDYRTLLITIWIFIFSLLIIKSYVIFRNGNTGKTKTE